MSHRSRFALFALLAVIAGCEGASDPVRPVAPAASNQQQKAVGAPDTSAVAHLFAGSGSSGTQVAGATIGAEGGSVELNGFEIVVPAGAVSTPTRFMIKIPNPAQQQKVGYAYAEFLPHNVDFAVPVTVILPHADTDADPDAGALWWNGNAWDQLITNSNGDGRINTVVDHFSYYATSRRGFTVAGG